MWKVDSRYKNIHLTNTINYITISKYTNNIYYNIMVYNEISKSKYYINKFINKNYPIKLYPFESIICFITDYDEDYIHWIHTGKKPTLINKIYRKIVKKVKKILFI